MSESAFGREQQVPMRQQLGNTLLALGERYHEELDPVILSEAVANGMEAQDAPHIFLYDRDQTPLAFQIFDADGAVPSMLHTQRGGNERGVEVSGMIALFQGDEHYCRPQDQIYVEEIFKDVSSNQYTFYAFREREPVIIATHTLRMARRARQQVESDISVNRLPDADDVRWMEDKGYPVHSLSDEECLYLAGLFLYTRAAIDINGTMIISYSSQMLSKRY